MRKPLLALAISGLLAFAFALTVFAAGAVRQVTNGTNDPYASCTAGAGTGRNYTRSEVEPYAAINPSNPDNIIAVWQQDRWSNGGAHGLAAGVKTSRTSGWRIVPLPFSACAPGTPADLQYERASDPWVSFGPGAPSNARGSTAYAVSLSFNQSPGKNGNTVAAAVSYDGGITWEHVQSLVSDPSTGVPLPTPDSNFQFFHDKEAVTADPSRPGWAYVVWDVLIGPNMSVEADLHSQSFNDYTLFSRTEDFGATWSPATIINTSAHPTLQHNQTIGNVIVVDRNNGTLYDIFCEIYNTGSNSGGTPTGAHGYNVAIQTSSDAGNTWTPSQIISPLLTAGVFDPNNVDPRTNKAPAPIRTGDIIPAPAIDPETGDLYAVWQDARFSGHDEIAISRSTDGGVTWSTPKRVNTPNGNPAFTATVAVLDSGRRGQPGAVGVTYYQFGATAPGSEPTTYFIKEFSAAAVSSSDPASIDAGVSATVVDGPFNMLDAPFAGGYFTGDYEALVTTGSGRGATFVSVFVQSTCADLSCSALTKVTSPADRTPTNRDSTDVYVGSGF
jgi:hypothetical protein